MDEQASTDRRMVASVGATTGAAPAQASFSSASFSITIEKVAQAMARHGVEPLPRNYELFHAAVLDRSQSLSREIAALGPCPSQALLDTTGLRRRLPGHLALGLEQAQRTALQTIGTAVGALQAESDALGDAFDQLDAFLARLDADPVVSMSDFAADAIALRQTLGRMRKREVRLALMLENTAATMADTRARIEADRRAGLRDPLTGLPNAAALSLKLAALFDDETMSHEKTPAALVLVVVERLRATAERHGSETGEKAVKKCASIFRDLVKKSDVVARIGFDAFAFLLHDVSELNAQAVATRMRDAVQSLQIRLPSREFTTGTLSLSAGIATTRGITRPQDLMRHAETALGVVRADGRQGILRCTPLMSAQIADMKTTEGFGERQA
jgi:diguanylate cyclase